MHTEMWSKDCMAILSDRLFTEDQEPEILAVARMEKAEGINFFNASITIYPVSFQGDELKQVKEIALNFVNSRMMKS